MQHHMYLHGAHVHSYLNSPFPSIDRSTLSIQAAIEYKHGIQYMLSTSHQGKRDIFQTLETTIPISYRKTSYQIASHFIISR